MKLYSCLLFLFLCIAISFAQNTTITASVELLEEANSLSITQEIEYTNTSTKTLTEIFLNDWANAFSHKLTPLGKKFTEDYERKFYYANEEERGSTLLLKLTNNEENLIWERPENQPDIIRVKLNKVLLPQQSLKLSLVYTVKIPSSSFTRFGYDDKGYKLNYWLITPSVYKNSWQTYSHKNLDDMYFNKFNLSLNLLLPKNYSVFSSLHQQIEDTQITLTGHKLLNTKLYLLKEAEFKSFNTRYFTLISNIDNNTMQEGMQSIIINRIADYLQQHLGNFPQDKMLLTQEDYLNNPVYGLNQLPKFIQPFPDGFQYEIKMLKSITRQYLANSLTLNPRTEKWVYDAITTKLMIDYVNTYYKDMKLLGNLSSIIGVRWFHLADVNFNYRYAFLYLNMARMNLDQPVNSQTDSLLKFNKNIAIPFKAGVGLEVLDDYLKENKIPNAIKYFFNTYQLSEVTADDFYESLQKYSNKNINWFKNDYINSSKKIDFKIQAVEKETDSLIVHIKNKSSNQIPVPVYGLSKNKIVYKTWVSPQNGNYTAKIPKKNVTRIAVNYEGILPEFNQRNNYKKVTGIFNRPPQIRLLKDIEDPRYQQSFLMPEFSYNLYDGLSLGPRLSNRSFLRKTFNYKISPKYGLRSNALVGSATLSNTHQYQEQPIYQVTYGFSGTRNSYAKNLFYYRFSPYLNIYFREPDLRNNKRQILSLRSVNVLRDGSILNPTEEPDYSIANIQYTYSNRNFINYFATTLDYQVAKKFSKISATAKWRKLFLNNRQIELRLFAGAFLFNESTNSNYFSFALDRPSDYMFDYNYYGRSESSGLFSQQYIAAEGGFKSKLEPAFANQYMLTANTSFTLWNWIMLYADVGIVKNRTQKAEFLYDSGIRLNLVQDYFEIYLPLYSSLGWEPEQNNYDQKIRFIISLDFNTLIKLFTRKWY
ncbi:hypothetical protein GGR32_000081 [Mesonia hippocampi]|uniref:Aminopeptidase n=1 Tax=Mesonia hippocampi TaxID=1628250 RepID=A0A840EHA6_9FLAO|nr:metalloprotease [Mesonia hippocampi]MBB4117809.1 hypothetical protein [Mesonia hippocampi]